MWLFAFLLIVPQLRYCDFNKIEGIPSTSSYNHVAIIIGSDLKLESIPSGWGKFSLPAGDSSWQYGSLSESDNVIEDSVDSSCELPIKELAAQFKTSKPHSVLYLQKGQEKFYLSDSGENPTYTITGTSADACAHTVDEAMPGVGIETYNYYWVFTVGFEESVSSITYLDQNEKALDASLTAGLPTTYVEGEGATLIAPTAPAGYDFVGWYDNAECTGEPVTAISADATGDKTFYAKWKIKTITVTLNNTVSCEGYMIYVYKGDTICKQIYVTTATYSFKLEWISNYSNTYRLAFVFGYYGNLTFTAKDTVNSINTNITTANRSATITSFVDTTIKFALVNPRINSTIII